MTIELSLQLKIKPKSLCLNVKNGVFFVKINSIELLLIILRDLAQGTDFDSNYILSMTDINDSHRVMRIL